MNRGWILLPCLIVLHSPDGVPIQLESSSIFAIRSTSGVQEHVAKGTNTVVYVGSKVFGVTDTPEDIRNLIERCKMEEGQ